MLIELLDDIGLALLVELAFRNKIITFIFLILIVLLISRRIMLILWKELFGKNKLGPIIAQYWPSRALVIILACWTILGIGNVFNIYIFP